MFETVKNAFKIKDIRHRIIFTFFMLIVIRIGSQLPIPGVDQNVFAQWFSNQNSDAFSFFDAVTGGSFLQMSVFALNITPYITSSIIMQLLTIPIPKLEEMQRDGEDGRKKIVEITRYLTIALALIESIAMAVGFGKNGYLTAFNAMNVFIVLTINIISRIPSDFASLFEQFVSGKTVAKGVLAVVIILAVILLTVVFVVLLQGAERRIPVQYSKKIQGRRQVGGQSTHIPLKVNTGGVIPVIFAQSLMQFPVVIASLLGKGNGTGIGSKILKGLSQSNWCDRNEPIYSIGLVVYIILIIAFAYFYTSITFNPLEVANNMKKAGGFIPGIRPGKPTSDYLTKILNYIIFIGAAGLTVVAVLPIFFSGIFNANVSFGGTSIIIIVGVVIETIKQIESQMLVRYYKGFLND